MTTTPRPSYMKKTTKAEPAKIKNSTVYQDSKPNVSNVPRPDYKAAADKAAGMKWTYVGAQPPPEGKINLPINSLTTGEPTILFITE